MRAVCRYEEDDYKWAENHGKRCFDGFSKREWSCSCHGKLKTLIATQCTQCSFWFHKTCKSQQRNAWESGGKKATAEWCLSCEEGRTPPERLAGCCNLQQQSDQPESERPASALTSASSRAAKSAQLDQPELELLSAANRLDEMPGTLSDGRVFVAPSGLGEHSGFGLFANVGIKRNEVVTPYFGTPMYRCAASKQAGQPAQRPPSFPPHPSQQQAQRPPPSHTPLPADLSLSLFSCAVHSDRITADFDTSYIMRIPNSGGVVVNGKVFADAIRSNTNNPAEDGRYYPAEGAMEWHLGAGVCEQHSRSTPLSPFPHHNPLSPPFHISLPLALPPSPPSMNNAMLSFQKPAKEKTGKMRELAPSLPVLVATRDIGIGEEVFYSYGSEKPVRAYPRHRDQTFRCLLASLLSPRPCSMLSLSLPLCAV